MWPGIMECSFVCLPEVRICRRPAVRWFRVPALGAPVRGRCAEHPGPDASLEVSFGEAVADEVHGD